ncbi:MAG: chemotaxis protein CheA [Sphingomonadales bacterium]|nr:chemotaxis protein CheA [Sphingomonadales bacterium]
MDDLRDEFIAETRETLEILSSQLVQWEKTPEDHGLIDSVFRFVHTVKGSCGFLDLPRLARLSHAAEEILSVARDGQLLPSSELVSAVLSVIDRIALLTDALETGEPIDDNDAELIQNMLAFLPTFDVDDVERADYGAGSYADLLADDLETIVKQRSQTVRIPLALLDKLMNGVSDLVLARNEVSRQLRRLHGSTDTDQAFERLSSTVSEIRDAVGHMRMQPIERLFSALPRLVRDMCIELDKEIKLEIDGSDVEIDREMVESLRDPLTHILRNAADHGIEQKAERIASGKGAAGRIFIGARQAGNQIVVEIRDDGRGIDLDKLRSRVLARKIVTEAKWNSLSEKEKLELIFAAGLSTADKVTAVSGRGVGMDIVRNNVQAIGGTIELENMPGNGLLISLRLPLTLSIIPALILKAGGGLYSLPRSTIVEILSASNKHVSLEFIGELPIANIRGQRLSFARLETVLQLEPQSTKPDHGRTVIVVRPPSGVPFALDVELVVDIEELVVKPVPPILAKSGRYAGTSLPDNGRPVLLLDASGLAEAIGLKDSDTRFGRQLGWHNEADAVVEECVESALVFEDWDGATRAIRLSVVDRMEDILPSEIHAVAGGFCVSRGDELSEIVGFSGEAGLEEIKMLRLSDGFNIRYLAVRDVFDIFPINRLSVSVQLPDTFEAVIECDGRPVELLNAYRLFENDPGSIRNPALCIVEADDTGGWERTILAPLLTASGYRVSFDDNDRGQADVILTRSLELPTVPEKTIRLLDSATNDTVVEGIYKYDRNNLVAAIETKLRRAVS